MTFKPTSVPSKRLNSSITATDMTFALDDIIGWDQTALTAADFGTQAYCVFRNAAKTQIELMEFDPSTIASNNITIVRRGLDFTGDPTTEISVNKYDWTSGDTYVDLGTDTPQLWQWLKDYIDGTAIAGAPDSSTSTKGLTKMSVAPAVASNPIAVGDNDPRIFASTTGLILMYGSATPPTGFLLCNGQAVSRTTYASLFAVTSTSYGVGDGSTTFNVPDLRSRFPLGYSASAPTKVFTFSSRTGNLITITGADNHAHNELQTGQSVTYSTSGTVITGLTNNTAYFVIRNAFNQFSLATSVANANAGTAIALSSDGTGTQTFTATYTVRPIAQTGGTETQSSVASHLHTLPNSGYFGDGGGTTGWSSASSRSRNPNTDIAGQDAPNNIPLFTVVNYIIKT